LASTRRPELNYVHAGKFALRAAIIKMVFQLAAELPAARLGFQFVYVA
jgi:hypothetical protein